jgi:hypothetical protein
VFAALPAVLGPTARTASPQCVACFSLLPCPLQCSRCGLPVCGEKCARMELHQPECQVLVLCRAKLRRTDKGEKVWKATLPSLTAAVTTLRLVSLKWREPGEWALVTNLMSDKLNPQVWAAILEVYRKVLHLDPRIEEEELKRVFGVQCTNGANLHFLPGHGRGLGVYPVQAFLNHSCMCNTVTGEHPGEHRVELRARWDVAAGEELTTSYIPPTQSSFTRRHLLHHTWGFWCACTRCRDPTECGSYLGALACDRQRCGGRLLHWTPLDLEAAWQCDVCGAERSAIEAATALQIAVMEIQGVKEEGPETVASLEELVAGLGTLLHSTHYIIMELQQRLLALYQQGGATGRPARDRTVQICRALLHYMALIDPDNQDSRKRRSIESVLLQVTAVAILYPCAVP